MPRSSYPARDLDRWFAVFACLVFVGICGFFAATASSATDGQENPTTKLEAKILNLQERVERIENIIIQRRLQDGR